MAISTSKQQVWCASPDWSVSSTTGSSIPSGMARCSVYRVSPAFRKLRFPKLAHGSFDNRLIPEKEHRSLMIEHGFLVPYFRKMFWTRAQFEARARAKGRI